MVGGLGARAHTLLPTVRSSGQPVNAREAWPFCPCSGEVFRGLGVAARSGRPERARPCAHCNTAAAGRAGVGGHCGPVGGKVALTATQSVANLKRAAVQSV